MRVVLRPQTRRDIGETFGFLLEEAGLEVALRFFESAECTASSLAEMPARGAPRGWLAPHLGDLRSWPVAGFEEHRLYYRVHADTVEVLRVLHGARDLDRLLDRDDPDFLVSEGPARAYAGEARAARSVLVSC